MSRRYTPHMHRDTRGTTIAEYAIMLFLILVVCAVAIKVLGIGLEKKFSSANKHVAGQGEQTSSASAGNSGGAQGGNAAAAGSAKAASGDTMGRDPTASAASQTGDDEGQQGGLPLVVRFALLALGVIGAAAAFFAIAKGNKTAGG